MVSFSASEVKVKASDELTDDAAATLAEVSEGEHGLKIKMHDKVKALELLGRHHGIFNDKLRLAGGLRVKLVDMTGTPKDEGADDAD